MVKMLRKLTKNLPNGGVNITATAVEKRWSRQLRPSRFLMLLAAIGFAMGASAATFDLANVTKNTSFPNGSVLTGTHGGGCQILIDDGATVTLSDATIKRTSNGGQYAGITCKGDAIINLVGDNEVTGYHFDHPAIYVPQGKTLTIKGPGTLNAATLSTYNSHSGWNAGNAAAIGGGVNKPCGNIVIESGIVNANAGFKGAGIGAGANGGHCGTITIKSGRITAKGGAGWDGNDGKNYGGAAIGGANKGNCVAIDIQDGVVTATGGYVAPGIGAGATGSSCGTITISAGTIKATGSGTSPGIGSGSGSCGNVSFSGGTIIAKGGDGAPGIGSGANGVCGTVYIGSGIKGLTAIRGKVSHLVGVTAPIGKGANGTCGTFDFASMPNMRDDGRMWVFKVFDLSTLVQNITVYNGMTLTGSLADSYKVEIASLATVTLQDAQISMTDDGTFPGINCLGTATLILKGSNTVKGHHENYPGIYVKPTRTLTIEGDGSLDALSNGQAAGIGGGQASAVKDCGNIIINGGTIWTYGGNKAAGIGGGGYSNGACGNITIGSGIVSVSARGGGNSIGAGTNGTGGALSLGSGLIRKDSTVDGKPKTVISAALRNLGEITSDTTFVNGEVLTGTLDGNTRHVKLTIADGATVTLSDAQIIGINTDTCKWSGLTCLGDATIILEGANGVQGFYEDFPGIYVPEGKTLTIKGEGSLLARSSIYNDPEGYGAAGIGGIYGRSSGNLVIEGGTIEAVGGGHAAGIGNACDYSASYCTNGYISILGGTVIARGGLKASGIGCGGGRSFCGDITIGPDVVSVTAIAGEGAPPIGKGFASASTCGTITVAEGLSDTTEGNTRTIRGGDLSKLTGDTVFGDGVTLKGTLAGNYKVSIADGATVTLRDVSILGWNNSECEWAGLTCEGDATIILKGENKVRGFSQFYPGIHVPEGKTLTIKGSGSLDVRSSGHAAGIGGGRDLSCGNIEIEGGTITAEGGSGSAGIGSGVSLYESVSCGDITLSGGTITATGGSGGSGIGTGNGTSVSATCGTIALSGATVTATGGSGASGIGAGDHGKCDGIVITSGAVTANAGTTGGNAAGIGSGERGEVPGGIDITGGIVFANATPGAMTIAPGIGSGASGSCGNINIGGYVVSVVATRGEHSMLTNSIGKAVNGSCGTVWVDPSLSDVTIGLTRTIQQADLDEIVDDTTFYDGTVIHGKLPVWSTYKLSIADGATVTLRDVMINGIDDPSYKWAGLTCLGDATIILEGENSVGGFEGTYPGIFVPEGKTLTIKGDGVLHAWSNGYGAGIGGGNSPGSSDLKGGNIVIEGGEIIATGGTGAAGIGGGADTSCGDITITGGDILARGGANGAGIGSAGGTSGTKGTCGDIMIAGGFVEAYGGANAPGIGSGAEGRCNSVTIAESAGSVISTKGEGAPYSVGAGLNGYVTQKVTVADEDKGVGIEQNPFIYPCLDAGKYFKATLAELGYDVPTDGTPYSVKALGLPAGLKLKYNAAVTKTVKGKKVVVTKAKSTWWIEGVPTSRNDYLTSPSYLVITANGKTETLPLMMQVAAQEVTDLSPLALGDTVNQQYFLPGVDTTAWTVTGLPTGLKYTPKVIYKDPKAKKKVVKYPAFTVYGKTTKAGRFTITAKKKKGAFYETKKFRLEVEPKAVDAALFGTLGGRVDTAYVKMADWNLKNDVAAVGGNVAKVTGLPPGLTFAASTTYKDKKKTQVKQQGQTIVGTPTKAGRYLVTFTKNVKSGKKTVAKTAQVWWNVIANPSTPEIYFNTSGGEVKECSLGVKYGAGYVLPSLYVTAGTTVTASGMPKGITFTDLGSGVWGFKGSTTKAGTYLVTVKATLNGNTVTQRIALKVNALPAWAKGSFNGGIEKLSDYSYCGLATVSVTSAGKISGKLFYDDGDGKPKTWTFSAPCFSDGVANEYFVEVTAKYAYKVKEKVKGKTKTVTKYLERPFVIYVRPNGDWGGHASINSNWLDSQVGEYGDKVYAYAIQNLWGSTYKTIGAKVFYTSKKAKYKVFKYTVDVDGKSCALSVKVTTAGKATATLTYDTGKKSKGKTVYYKPTCSTVVLQNTTPDAYYQSKYFQGSVDLYFAPSAGNNFPGYADHVTVQP